MSEPRGFRCKNPGNLRKGEPWQGLAEAQPDPDFCTFETMTFGIRALAKLLLGYEKKFEALGKPVCVGTIIARYAPPHENDTSAYALDVAARLGVALTTPLDLGNPTTLRSLVRAIARHENGAELDWDETNAGVKLALGLEKA